MTRDRFILTITQLFVRPTWIAAIMPTLHASPAI
jgi:hypothetical protein